MNPPRRQKKYLTRAMIESDIDTAYRQIASLERQMAVQEDFARASRKLCTPHGDELAAQALDQSRILCGRIERLKEGRLGKLKRTLAAFDTEPFGFADEQVVLQQK